MMGLCSKTYIVGNGDQYKFSSKGVNKNTITQPLSVFREVFKNW